MRRFNFQRPELRVKGDEPPGCDSRYELAEEAWLLVLEGRPTARTPAGEVMEAGDIACLARGPAGAHKTSNFAGQPSRVIMISERAEAAGTVYEDSDKVGVFAPDTRLLFRRADAVDYREGEGAREDPDAA